MTANAVLARGGTIVMYVEGRARARVSWRTVRGAGIGRLVLDSGAPVLPVSIHGSSRVRNWKRLQFPEGHGHLRRPDALRRERPTPPTSSRWAWPRRCSPRSRRCTAPDTRSTLAATNLPSTGVTAGGGVHMFRLGALARAVVCAGLAILVLAPSAFALDDVNTKKLRDAVTVNGILGHERALQRIANMNGGTRASGTPASRRRSTTSTARLDAAGYRSTVQEFTFPFFRDWTIRRCRGSRRRRRTTRPRRSTFSGSGDVTGKLVPVNDNQSPPPADAELLERRLRGRGLHPGVGDRPADRPDPARHLQLRGQGRERAGRWL